MYVLSHCLVFLFVVNDTLDDILGDSDEEEESDAIVTQVLDEIGIDISGKVGATIICTILCGWCYDQTKLFLTY